MVSKVINLYKPVGMTPLQAIQRLRKQDPNLKSKKMGYAGRLDPMAEGVLLLLVGEENKKIGGYMRLEKEYRAQFLLGFESDSFDILGLAKKKVFGLEEKELKKKIKNFKGNYHQTLPAFSSYRIRGKTLFSYARKGKLDDIELPKKTVSIKEIKINSIYTISSNRLLKQITRKINLLEGDFRQEEIIKTWNKILKESEEKFTVADVTISCSSGTYIRSIANDLGSILINLIRTRVDKYAIRDSKRLKKS